MIKKPVIDFHCDALSKMLLDPKLDFTQDERLDVNLTRMEEGGVRLQCFAIFLSQSLGKPKIEHILNQIDIFNQRVIRFGVTPVFTAEDFIALEQSGGQGGILSLEGADGLEGNLFYLQLCYEKGVRFLGLTWNYANWAADGILEPRGGGLTPEGVSLVKACHELGMILDVSHLSVKGFWELAELAGHSGRPFIASHSNAHHICPNARNLRDDQIKEIIRLGGKIGINMYPPFVKEGENTSIRDILPHIDHICSLGGEHTIMLGSDFDGIEIHLSDLQHAGQYADFANFLLKHYSEELVWGWLYGNAAGFLKAWLPPKEKAL
ncbi:dipeptidase [Paenibacillus puldeungensis]|uniref:Dipeptidase n=1 Tax=Paenibacillus puldeungensis TaxID=696536 RepID=A0ABW3RYN1_9BACL